MRVRDIMTHHVVTVHTDTSIFDALGLLARHGITAMPVTEGGELIGMVSEADLLRAQLSRDPRVHQCPAHSHSGRQVPPAAVNDVMSTPVVAVSEGAQSSDAAGLMLDYGVRSIPVVDGGTVTGIVSRRDLIRVMVLDRDETIGEQVQERLDEYVDRGWAVTVSEGAVTITGDFAGENERRVVSILARTVPGVTSVRTGPRTVAI